jgi:2-methylcitrate dehydratase PrpD
MLTDRLCAHIAQTPASAIPESTLAATRLALLDALGVMLAASTLSTEAEPFRKLALAGGTGRSTLLGRSESVPAPTAALANGALAHALDFEDAFDAAPATPMRHWSRPCWRWPKSATPWQGISSPPWPSAAI